MRILLTTDPIGGVWTFTKDLTTELLARGHQVALVSVGGTPHPGQQAFCEGLEEACGAAFHFAWSDAPLEWMQDNLLAYQAAAPWLQDVANSFSPHILHCNQFCFGRLPLECPRLITAHSDVLSWAEACRPEGLKESAWLDRYVALVQQGLAGTDAVTAPTEWMLSALQRNFATPDDMSVIANGRTLPEPHENSERKLQAVSAGRLWDEAKNLALLTRIRSPLPILIAGERQSNSAAAPPISPSLQLLGHLQENDLLDLFRRSSLYLAPSIYEPFGLAPLEAALCGCAVLANDIASLREVWGDAALYFHDEPSLESLLWALLADPAMLAAARHASTRRALELNASRMAERYLSLYEDILRSPIERHNYELSGHAS